MSGHDKFGFNIIWPIMTQEVTFFKTLALRVAREGDKFLISGALALLNAIMKTVSTEYFNETIDMLEAYSFRKAVIVSHYFSSILLS